MPNGIRSQVGSGAKCKLVCVRGFTNAISRNFSSWPMNGFLENVVSTTARTGKMVAFILADERTSGRMVKKCIVKTETPINTVWGDPTHEFFRNRLLIAA